MAGPEPVVYFHGLPGGPAEIEACGRTGGRTGGRQARQFHVPDRQADCGERNISRHFDALASGLATRFGTARFRILGFSLGAYVALEVAARLGPAVSRLSLVSAAAPLSLGDFLPDMAGRAVFRAARDAPLRFGALTSIQSLAARVAPGLLFAALFAGARGRDRRLAAQPRFRAGMAEALGDCLRHPASGYRLEVKGYVRDWSPVLSRVTQPVELWHGSLDNWAPPAMAEALARALPNVTTLHRLDGHGHYSTLQAWLEQAAGNAGD